MSSNEKVRSFFGDRKEEVVGMPLSEKKSPTKDIDRGTDELVDIPLMEKKSSTKYVDKGTDELADMKQAVITIRRKGFDQFEGQSKGSTGWFKLDSDFLKQHFLRFIQNYIKKLKNIEDQYTELYTTFIVPFDEEFIKTTNEKKIKHDF